MTSKEYREKLEDQALERLRKEPDWGAKMVLAAFFQDQIDHVVEERASRPDTPEYPKL